MQRGFLEVTFRRGRALAGYYHLPRRLGVKVARSRPIAHGLVVDYGRRGEPLGIEITAPRALTLARFNRVLRELGLAPLKRADLKPLRAA